MPEPDYWTLYNFTYRNEVQEDVSNRPYWPGGNSGLTLGPGYDIGSRSLDDVRRFLRDELGLSEAAVNAFAGGAGLQGEAARQYLHDHRADLDLIRIDRAQEQKIFCLLAPEYEARAQRVLRNTHPDAAWDALDDHQKCLLFDYEYNVGLSRFPQFVNAVLARDWTEARRQCIRKGLEGKRRETETFALLEGLASGNMVA